MKIIATNGEGWLVQKTGPSKAVIVLLAAKAPLPPVLPVASIAKFGGWTPSEGPVLATKEPDRAARAVIISKARIAFLAGEKLR